MMLRHTFLCSLMLAALCAAGPVAKADTVYSDSIIAVVNEEVITLYDVVGYTRFYEQRLRQMYNRPRATAAEQKADIEEYQKKVTDLRREAAERLIDMEVIFAEFTRQGFQVPNDAVERRVDQYVQERTKSDYQKFEEELSKDQMTMKAFREQVRKSIAVEMLEHTVLDGRVVVTPRAIDAYYTANSAEFAEPTMVTMQVIELPRGTDSDAAFAERCAKVKAAVSADGSNFGDLARQYSVNVPTKEAGGLLGTVKASEMRADFKAAFSRIATGEISTWVPNDGGKSAFLLRLQEVKSFPAPPLDDALRKSIRSKLFEKERDVRRKEFVANLRGKAYIRTFYEEQK